jgi:hypothetical protein
MRETVGVARLYGYPGGGINGLLGAFGKAGNQPEFIQARHETNAACMACTTPISTTSPSSRSWTLEHYCDWDQCPQGALSPNVRKSQIGVQRESYRYRGRKRRIVPRGNEPLRQAASPSSLPSHRLPAVSEVGEAALGREVKLGLVLTIVSWGCGVHTGFGRRAMQARLAARSQVALSNKPAILHRRLRRHPHRRRHRPQGRGARS